MAVNNLMEFNNQWILFGLLFFSMLTFAITFTASNNPDALGDSQDVFDNYSDNFQSKLIVIDEDSNKILNITSQSNPDAGFLGSRDSVATSYGITGTSRSFFQESKVFMGWIFSGTSGQIIIAVIVGMFSFTALFFIVKWIRQGG
tara:strand:+ start:684 stop:1118 length:435 start_codon:yes stop_codon:yes gene_type:complete